MAILNIETKHILKDNISVFVIKTFGLNEH